MTRLYPTILSLRHYEEVLLRTSGGCSIKAAFLCCLCLLATQVENWAKLGRKHTDLQRSHHSFRQHQTVTTGHNFAVSAI